MQISKHCYVVSGLCAEPPWAVTAGFIAGNHTTLIVDTGANYLSAQTLFGYATCANATNRLIAVNTEPHFDHIGGNSFFVDHHIAVFAHPELQRTGQAFLENKSDYNQTIANSIRRDANESDIFFFNTRLSNPTHPLRRGYIFDLGDVHVKAHHTPGHTPLNISLQVLEDNVWYCGDTIVTGYIPNLEGGDVTAWQKWMASLEMIDAAQPRIIVPGHGDIIRDPEDQRLQLQRMRHFLTTAIRDGVPPTR